MIFKKRHFLIYFKISVFICWLFLIFKSLFLPMVTLEADAYSRLGIGVFRSLNDCWPPFYPKIIEFSLMFYNGFYYIAPRLVTVISILFSGIIVEKIIFKSIKSSVFSVLGMILFLFHPLVIDLSTITLSEPVWAFFVLASIFFVFYSEKKYSIYIGLLLWSVSQGIRYESWFLTPIFLWCLIVCQKITKKNMAIVLSGLFITPVFWIVFSHFQFNNGLQFLKSEQACVDKDPIPEWMTLKNIVTSWYQLLTTHIFPFPVVILYLASLFTSKKTKDLFVWLSPIALFIMFVTLIFTKKLSNITPRFLFIIIPLTIIVLMISISRLRQAISHHFFWSVLFILVIIFSIGSVYFQKTYPFYNKSFDGSDEIFLISKKINLDNNWRKNVIFIHVQEPRVGHLLSYLDSYQNPIYRFNCTDRFVSDEIDRNFKEGDYLLSQTNFGDNSCNLLLKDEILISKTDSFELYLKK